MKQDGYLAMESLNCIIHYSIKDANYSKIKPISEINRKRIIDAKSLRESKGGLNYHKEQCDSIPEEIDPSKHGIHLEPCYKKFVLILSQEKASSDKEKQSLTTARPKRQSSDQASSRNIYPKECQFCKRYRVKHKGKEHIPLTITTTSAAAKIKEAAEAKAESLYYEIKDLDLIAKEFKYHVFCYKDFVRQERPSQSQGQADSGNLTGNFEAVIDCIEKRVLSQNQAVSMSLIHEIYGIHIQDTRYRNKLKSRIQSYFPEKLFFVSVSKTIPEVVISKDGINSHTLLNNPDIIIKEAAELLRSDILDYANNIPELKWPPYIEDLKSEDMKPPQSLLLFLSQLLKANDHSESYTVKRLVESYSSDLIHGVTRGKVITAKHFLLGLGLHNITGQKKPIQILNRLGHCIEYNVACEIETAHAEASQQQCNDSGVLPLRPTSGNHTVNTFFWADNFDINLETQTGHGALNSTHMIAFQEESHVSLFENRRTRFTRTGRRSLTPNDPENYSIIADPKKEPNCLNTFRTSDNDDIFNTSPPLMSYFLWLVLRMLNSRDQTVPSFFAWKSKVRNTGISRGTIKETVVTYLPPIDAKVTQFSTINQYLSYMQELAGEANMPYVNVSLDVGAAMNAYKLVWNYPKKFENVLIHLGDFHFIKENFGVIGKLVAASGFEDVAFQAGVCSTGSLKGVLAGTHYNRAWTVHSVFAEALERLLFERFIAESGEEIPVVLHHAAQDPFQNVSEILGQAENLFLKFQKFKNRVRSGELGKTAQFWLSLYLDLMSIQQAAHLAVQENDFEVRHSAWKQFLPLYFALNKTNYARYASYYVGVLENIDLLYPDAKQLLSDNGFSVQAQDRYLLRTAVDQRGEQTINRDAKTAGGIKFFANDSKSVLKWTLNRSEQANNTSELLNMVDMKSSNDMYKSLRPSMILKTEKMAEKVVKVLKDEYVNPFGAELDKHELYNLSSGVPLPGDISDQILAIRDIGRTEFTTFVQERLIDKSVPFHDSISRHKLQLFSSTSKQVEVRGDARIKAVEVNRDMLGTILALSAKTGRVVNFEYALEYPLCAVPLSLANPDGSRRVTAKSKLMHIIEERCRAPLQHPRDSQPSKQSVAAYIIDFMACIRVLRQIPETYEGLTWTFLEMLPSGYKRVDIVADTYQDISIKSTERSKRGSARKIIVRSEKSKIPRDFNAFLKNGENKARMIELIVKVIVQNKVKVLSLLQSEEIFVSTENHCSRITAETIEIEQGLVSNQEEADTKVVLHCIHALNRNPGKNVIVRSPSGDTDIAVIMIGMLIENKTQCFLDNGTGNNRKGLWLSDVDMSEDAKLSLIGFHAFTGNDYISSFFRKGKAVCWKVAEKNPRFLHAFKALGLAWDLQAPIYEALEEYVCYLYGSKKRKVNEVRHQMFQRKYANENKIVDLASLPPCQSVLKLHTSRANFVSKLWKSAGDHQLQLPNLPVHSWTDRCEIVWMHKAFPENIEELLLEQNLEEIEDDDFGRDDDTDDDDDESQD